MHSGAAPRETLQYDFFIPVRSIHVIKVIDVMSLPLAKGTDGCPDGATVAPLVPLIMYDVLSEEVIRRVQHCTGDRLHVALEDGLIGWPDATDEATIPDIQSCYRSGLTPEEGVQYCFCTRS